MADKKGPPLYHRHKTCGHLFEPVQVCSECGEALDPRQVQVEIGPGARDPAHLPIDEFREKAEEGKKPRAPKRQAAYRAFKQ